MKTILLMSHPPRDPAAAPANIFYPHPQQQYLQGPIDQYVAVSLSCAHAQVRFIYYIPSFNFKIYANPIQIFQI